MVCASECALKANLNQGEPGTAADVVMRNAAGATVPNAVGAAVHNLIGMVVPKMSRQRLRSMSRQCLHSMSWRCLCSMAGGSCDRHRWCGGSWRRGINFDGNAGICADMGAFAPAHSRFPLTCPSEPVTYTIYVIPSTRAPADNG